MSLRDRTTALGGLVILLRPAEGARLATQLDRFLDGLIVRVVPNNAGAYRQRGNR